MPGMIVKYEKKVGDAVNEGETVVILEAMKMENALAAPAAAPSRRSTTPRRLGGQGRCALRDRLSRKSCESMNGMPASGKRHAQPLRGPIITHLDRRPHAAPPLWRIQVAVIHANEMT
jgi:hypothetical protein